MNLTQFEVKTTDGITVKGEYEGNEASKKVIIFSHGFGVARDSRGMFNELGDLLKEKYLVVRFDYTDINKDENWTKVYPFRIQENMLKAVYNFVITKFSPDEVNIIAHSMGCLIAGLTNLKDIKKTVLLAGPILPPYLNLKKRFLERPETKIDESGVSMLKRSDGSITYVNKDFWKDIRLVNPLQAYRYLSKESKTIFVKALSDQVLGLPESEYRKITKIPMIEYFEIPGKHDFSGSARKGLKDLLRQIFLENL